MLRTRGDRILGANVIYQCKACQYEEARGCLPTVSCGIYLFGLMGLWLGVMSQVIPALRAFYALPEPPAEAAIPWWWWPLIFPLGFVFAFLGAVLLDLLFSALEWLLFAARRCPICGKRRWSWGFTRGFGL